MQETLLLVLAEFTAQQLENRLQGYLSFIENLMMATEILGVGCFRPHNSLVPISTVHVRIDNDVTLGNDVSQSFEKKVPGHIILFELLSEVSERFRCTACEIVLHEGSRMWPEKWNGLTLEELKIDKKVLRASKSPREKIRQ
jgi:hypothetical protein